MRDVDERDLDVVLDRLQLELHLLSQLQVERAERLVEQEDTRAVDERARQRHALLLAAGKLSGLPSLEPLEPDDVEHLLHRAHRVLALDALAPQAERDVVAHVQVREKRIGLEHGVDVAPVRGQPGHGAVAEEDRPLGRLLEATDHPQRRRLPAAGRSQQGEEAAARDLEGQRVDGDDVVEALRHVHEPDVRDGGRSGRVGRGSRRALIANCAHAVTFCHASARTSPSTPVISSNSAGAAIRGGEIWITGSPRSSARQIRPRSKSRGERN